MKRNPTNERIKRDYFHYLREAMGRDEATVYAVAKSLSRFETSTRAMDFKCFHREQAVAFKKRLAEQCSTKTGERLAKATLLSTLRQLRAFFLWLAHEPGYKSKIAYTDANYFNLSDKEVAIARARRVKRVPTLAQAERALAAMPVDTLVARRNQALFALCMLTGARVAALVSLRVGHLNISDGYVEQDARTVSTKFGKTFRTWLMPVCQLAEQIVSAWHSELSADPTRGPDDPLFPATAMGLTPDGLLAPIGLANHGWRTTSPVRAIFRRAFAAVDLSYFNPHGFRDMLVHYAMSCNLPPEAMKAWSQNLGHANVLTTFTSYGAIPDHRQGELVKATGTDASQSDIALHNQIAHLVRSAKRQAAETG